MTASGEIVKPREVAEHLRNIVCKPEWLAAHAYTTINEMVVLYIHGEREVAWVGTSTCTESSSWAPSATECDVPQSKRDQNATPGQTATKCVERERRARGTALDAERDW
ncbi:hypothetical protein T492DRAFT_429711 [Pavlovales sp. CCMP2436]|nr:hypothetical protein T492DRAFT_429711 [Pavlovales sp. CCMP2436]